MENSNHLKRLLKELGQELSGFKKKMDKKDTIKKIDQQVKVL